MSKSIVVIVSLVLLLLSAWLFFRVMQTWIPGELFRPSSSLLDGQKLQDSKEDATVKFYQSVFTPGSNATLDVVTGGTLLSGIYSVTISSDLLGLDEEVLLDGAPYSWEGTITQVGGNDFVGDEQELHWEIPRIDELAGKFIDITVKIKYSAAKRSGIDTYANSNHEVEIPLTIRLLTDSEVAEVNEATMSSRLMQIAFVVGFVISDIILIFLVHYLYKDQDNPIIRIFAFIGAAMLGIMLFALMTTAPKLGNASASIFWLVFLVGAPLAFAIGGAVYLWVVEDT